MVLSCILITVLAVAILPYVRVVWKWLKRWDIAVAETSNNQPINRTSLPAMTALIPCRNDAHHLDALLRDLKSQTHPIDILVIDDGSTDGSIVIAQKNGVRCISSLNDGKKSALQTGAKAISTPWLATLDADVRLEPEWAETMLNRALTSGAGAVAGGVRITPTATGRERFEALEYGGLMVWIGGGMHAGTLAMGSGANLIFDRDSYPADALQNDVASGDDAFALEALRQCGIQTAWCGHEHAIVRTHPTSGWLALWQQRARWASKTGRLQSPEARQIAWLVAIATSAPVITALVALITGHPWGVVWSCIAWLIKIVADMALIQTAAKNFNLSLQISDFVAFNWRYPVLVAGAWWAIICRKVVWKGRRI